MLYQMKTKQITSFLKKPTITRRYWLMTGGVLFLLVFLPIVMVFESNSISSESTQSQKPTSTPSPSHSPSPSANTPSPTSTTSVNPTINKSLGSFTMKNVVHKTGEALNHSSLTVTLKKTDGTYQTSYTYDGIKTTNNLIPGEYLISNTRIDGYRMKLGGCTNTTCYWQDAPSCSAKIVVKAGETSELLCRYVANDEPLNEVIYPTKTDSGNDTTPPSISMTGPENGSTVDFKNFCFPMYPTDNQTSSSEIQIRVKFDQESWSDWGNNVAPCYYDIPNGQHTFSVEVKDTAGNTASETRTFTVQG